MKGKNVYLRAPEAADCDTFVALARASEKSHRGSIKMSRTREEFALFLERSRSETSANFLIFRIADDAIVGMVNLSQIFYGPFCNAYLGYGLGDGFTGRGFMTEAIQLVLRFAFSDLILHRVEANVQPENTASINVLRRTGFQKEGFSKKYLKVGGRWRDHERWAITRENWKPKL
ncbi:MAG TPA: GNAT family protein [Pyrinomonadaceae bacterium]|nr:GNAT family protein [Pyrinomonadaceae bacterium]